MCSGNRHCMLSFLLNLWRCVLWPRIWFDLNSVFCTLERTIYFAISGLGIWVSFHASLFLNSLDYFYTFYYLTLMHPLWFWCYIGLSQWGGSAVKVFPCNAEDAWNRGSIPGPRRCPAGGHGIPLQDSCLQNPMGRWGWQATVHGVTKSRTQLKWLSTQVHIV